MTQAAIIATVFTFSSGFLIMIAVYADSTMVRITCTAALTVIVYLALRFLPRLLKTTTTTTNNYYNFVALHDLIHFYALP